jgi:hypothetical protein
VRSPTDLKKFGEKAWLSFRALHLGYFSVLCSLASLPNKPPSICPTFSRISEKMFAFHWPMMYEHFLYYAI